MKRTNWPVEEYGIRPAGDPDKCFYCGESRGGTHKEDCVIRERTIVVKMSIEYTIAIPEFWTKEQLEFHRNQGTWCSDNGLLEIDNFLERTNDCGCGRCEWEYIREATVEDEEIDRLSVNNLPS